jgi:hypothetical protein
LSSTNHKGGYILFVLSVLVQVLVIDRRIILQLILFNQERV